MYYRSIDENGNDEGRIGSVKRRIFAKVLVCILLMTTVGPITYPARVYAVSENLAIGAAASMNANVGWGNIAAYAIDGNYTTHAQTSEAGVPWDLTIDLGTKKVFDQVKFTQDTVNYATKFDIQISNDGISYETVFHEYAGTAGTTSAYDFAPVQARYLKINVTEISGTNLAMKEVEIFSTKNLAAGASMTMLNGSPAWGNTAGKAGDSSLGSWAQGDTAAWDLQIDLAAVQTVNRIVFISAVHNYATAFTIKTSADGSAWTTVATENNYMEALSETYDFPPVQARYVKIDVTAEHNGGAHHAISEVAVYNLSNANLALNKTVLASIDGSAYTGGWWHSASKAVDGDETTYAQPSEDVSWDLTIDLGTIRSINKVFVLPEENNFPTWYSIKVSKDNSNWYTVTEDNKGWGYKKEYHFANTPARYVKIDVNAKKAFGYAMKEIGIFNSDNRTNLALGKTVTSSNYNGSWYGAPGNAVDGTTSTYVQPQTDTFYDLQIDLVNTANISRVVMKNDSVNYPTWYSVKTSLDGTDWVTVAVENIGAGEARESNFLNRQARYVRIVPTVKVGQGPYAIREIEVYGTAALAPAAAAPLPTPTPIPSSTPAPSALPSPTPLLLFLIDEGMPTEFIYANKDNYSGMDPYLDNIYNALADLATDYRVGVLIYPTQFYDKYAYGVQNPQPIDRIHGALKYVLNYFENKDNAKIKVYLELISSGIKTNQNGEISLLPPPPIHVTPGAEGHYGLSMDVDALAALKAAYPDALEGVRFHEMYGSDAAYKTNPIGAGSHGFSFDSEAVKGVIDVCGSSGLKLAWSDSCWLMKEYVVSAEDNYVYSNTFLPYNESRVYANMQNYAENVLGQNVTFVWANNNYHPAANLEYLDAAATAPTAGANRPLASWLKFDLKNNYSKNPVRSRNISGWGMSLQNWMWAEMTASITGKYYMYGELFCPEEILGSYILKGLGEGATYFQFESSPSFFNMQVPYVSTAQSCQYEQQPDYTGTNYLKRLKHILLNPQDADNPAAALSSYFDTNLTKLMENDAANAPKTYLQNTLGVLWDDQTVDYYDFYNDGRTWVGQNENRFGSYVFSSDKDLTCRFDLQGDGVDEFVVVKNTDSAGRQLYLYNCFGGLMANDSSIAADNSEGSFVALTTANLEQKVTGEGDPDEIVVARRKAGDSTINLRVYRVASYQANPLSVTFTAVSDNENQALLSRVSDEAQQLRSAAFMGMSGLRPKSVRYYNDLRNLDDLIIANRDATNLTLSKKASGQVGSSTINYNSLNTDGKFVCISADYNSDRTDELFVVRQSAQGSYIDVYNSSFTLLNTKTLSTATVNISSLLSKRYGILLNDKYALPSGNLAIGAAATMSEPAGWGNTANKAIDGDVNTWAQSNNEKPWDLTIELPAVRNANCIMLLPMTGTYPCRYKVLVSANGTNWTTVADEQNGIGTAKTYNFTAQGIKYVKIDSYDVMGTTYYAGFPIREVGIYNN